MKIKCVPHLQKQNNTSFRSTPKDPLQKIIQRGVEDISVCMYSVFLSILLRRYLWSISSLLFTPSYDFPSVRYIIMHKIMMEKTLHQQPTLSVCQHSSLYQPFNDQKIYLSIRNGFFSTSIKLQEDCAAVEPSVGTLLLHVVGIGSPFFQSAFWLSNLDGSSVM